LPGFLLPAALSFWGLNWPGMKIVLAELIGPDLIVLKPAPFGALFMLGVARNWQSGQCCSRSRNGPLQLLR
jgi:hypothetical protein